MKNLTAFTGIFILTALGATATVADTTGDRLHDIAHLFEAADFVSGPVTVDCKLSGGTETTCFQITVRGLPTDRDTGPWCPTNISDGPKAAGIWLENGEVLDADGTFIKNLAEFYQDDNWQMFDPETGAINFTETAQECQLASRPNVDPALQNHCVQCLPEYVEPDLTTTYTIPLEPVPSDRTPDLRRGGSRVALDGVKLEAAAPVKANLGAYTIAPFDDCGGHINLVEGYHYHAATGRVAV